jgi:PleD family two-component response regulator
MPYRIAWKIKVAYQRRQRQLFIYRREIEIMETKRRVVLVIDDIIPSLKSTEKILENTFDVRLAKSIETASRILKTNSVDLILLDIEMPEMSGLEYMKQLREIPQYRDIPIIFVTSHSTREFFTQAMSSGARDFIVKPVSQNILIEKIYAALGGKPSETVSRETMEQILTVLKKTCKKGMEAKAGAMIKEIRHKHFNPATDARVAEICDLITQGNYKTAMEKIKAVWRTISLKKVP